jgi:hypothetical protein
MERSGMRDFVERLTSEYASRYPGYLLQRDGYD